MPHDRSGTSQPRTAGGSTTPASWVFPFNKPLAPGKGDNQALAVNTTDNTIQYDVAFALVWVEDDSPALNKNEAYAFASCKNCAAVSVGFQVVLVTGNNHVAVPQNLSAAVNYNCVDCLTYALATQLFVTLDGPLSDAGTKQLEALWKQIADFGANIASVPLSEIRDRLSTYEQQILDIIGADQGGKAGDTAQAGGTGDGSGPSQAPSQAPSAEPTDTAADTGTTGDTAGSDGTSGTTDSGTTGSGTTGSGTTDPGTTGSGTTDTGTSGSGTATDTQPTPADQPTPASEPSTAP